MTKEIYIGIVRFTLESMMELSKTEREYDLMFDTIHYYNHIIVPEQIITKDEFLSLCIEVGISDIKVVLD